MRLAESHGATLQFNEAVLAWYKDESCIDENGCPIRVYRVKTDKAEYKAKKIVLSVGPWAPELYGDKICLPLHIERRVLYWFRPKNEKLVGFKVRLS